MTSYYAVDAEGIRYQIIKKRNNWIVKFPEGKFFREKFVFTGILNVENAKIMIKLIGGEDRFKANPFIEKHMVHDILGDTEPNQFPGNIIFANDREDGSYISSQHSAYTGQIMVVAVDKKAYLYKDGKIVEEEIDDLKSYIEKHQREFEKASHKIKERII